MTNLMCSVQNCQNYQNNLCTLSSIQVDGRRAHSPRQTCCSSFQERGQGASNDISTEQPEIETQVKCDAATCAFNHSGACSAETITVTGSGAQSAEQTECSSFETK